MPVRNKPHQKVDTQIKTFEAYDSKWKIRILVYYNTRYEEYLIKGEIIEQTRFLAKSITYSDEVHNIPDSSNLQNQVEELSEKLLEKAQKQKDAEKVNIDINVNIN